MHTIRILALACLLGFLLQGCQSSTAQEETADMQRPNILLFLTDDQSWLHAGAYGNEQVRTPAFDRVAQEGVLFTHSFATAPSCTPSRSSILTGQEIWRIREAGVLFGSIPPDIPLFTHLLADAGYHVGYTGKGWAPGNWSDLGLDREPLIKAYNDRLEVEIAEFIDRRDYTANFEDFLEDRQEGAPFFFWMGTTEPHREYQYGVGEKEAGHNLDEIDVPPFLPDHEIVRRDIADYYYEIEWLDTHLASTLEVLEERGELDNTLVVVTSDNGMPFPRAKVNLYDWGTRMPLAIRWGKEVPAGRTIDDFVSHTDFAPSFLEAAGVDIPNVITGRSLLSMLRSESSGRVEEARDHVYTALERHTYCRPDGATYPARALRTYDYLYIRNFEPDRWPTGGPSFVSSNKTFHGDIDACPTKTVMMEGQETYPRLYELGFGKRPLEELYRVADDPGQIHNLAGDANYAAVKDSLYDIMETHLRATGDPRIEGQDPWQDIVYHQTTGFGSTYNELLSPAERARARLRPSNHPELPMKALVE